MCEDKPVGVNCTPGKPKTTPCCPGGHEGIQVCDEKGYGYGSCQCPDFVDAGVVSTDAETEAAVQDVADAQEDSADSQEAASDAPAEVESDAQSDVASVAVNRNDNALDVLVVVDVSTYRVGNYTFAGYGHVSDAEIVQVMDSVKVQLQQNAHVQEVLLGIERVSFGVDLDPEQGGLIQQWVTDRANSASNPPEAVIVLSKAGIAWTFGGYSGASMLTAPSYCNEWEMFVPSPMGQRYVAIAVIDWDHGFGVCGYDHEHFPGNEHVSDKPTAGECRGDLNDTCVPSPYGTGFVCQSVLSDPSMNPLAFRSFVIIHELLHAVDLKHLGHGGDAACFGSWLEYQADGGLTQYGPDQQYYTMCPMVIMEFASHLKGCPTGNL